MASGNPRPCTVVSVTHDYDQDGEGRSQEAPNAEALWTEALRDRATARLLNDAISSKTLSRVLLLNREDLFPTFNVFPDERFSLTFSSRGFAYLTHSFKETQVSLAKLWKKCCATRPRSRGSSAPPALLRPCQTLLATRFVTG